MMKMAEQSKDYHKKMIEQPKDFQEKLAAQSNEFNNNLLKIVPLFMRTSETVSNNEEKNGNGKNKENNC